MEIEYKINYKSRNYPYWAQYATSFKDYPEAKTEFNRLLKEGFSGTYQIVKITHSYEVVKEETK